MLRQVVVLAGGLGTRLGDRVAETPKPLLEVAGRPFLVHVIENLRRYGLKRFLLSVGYLGDRIASAMGDGSDLGVEFEYAFEEEPLGTGGALKAARSRLDESFLLVNGDTLFDLNVLALAQRLTLGDTLAAVGLRHVEDASRYGRVIHEEGRILRFEGAGHSGPGWINGGVYAIRGAAIDRLPDGKSSLERDLLPGLAEEHHLAGMGAEGFFIDIGVPEDLARSHEAMAEWRHRPAVFFDRDEVLNEDPGYVHRPEDLIWKPGAIEAVRWVNDRGWLAIVITNQAGIAKGHFAESDFHAFTNRMRQDLAEAGAHFDAIYYCPFHPEGNPPYRQGSPDRKPAPGMFLRAIREWDVDVLRSFSIGDRETDLQASEAAGVRAVLYRGENLLDLVRSQIGE